MATIDSILVVLFVIGSDSQKATQPWSTVHLLPLWRWGKTAAEGQEMTAREIGNDN